jgi:hypothetical protein
MMLHLQQRVAILAVSSLLLLGAQSNASAEDGPKGYWVGTVFGVDTYLNFTDGDSCSFNKGINCQATYPLADDPYHNISFMYQNGTQTLELRGNFDGNTIEGVGFFFSPGTECPLPSKWTRPSKSRVVPLLPSSFERSPRIVEAHHRIS